MIDVDLVRELRALAPMVELPRPAELDGAVRRAIAAIPQPRPSAWRPALVPTLATIAALVAAIGVVLASFPQARETVADWLGVGGIDIQVRPDAQLPPSRPEPLDDATVVSLADAQDAVPFPVRVPVRLGDPDRVYIDESFPDGVVTMVWAPADDRPEVLGSGIGALLSTFRSDVDRDFATKVVQSLEHVERADVGGTPALWFGGPAHLLVTDANGGQREVTGRLAGHTLVWERDGLTYRLEADLGRRAMVEIAESVP